MFIDASALVAILKGEPEADMLLGRLTESRSAPIVSAIARFEATASIAEARARSQGRTRAAAEDFDLAQELVDELIAELKARDAPISDRVGRVAIEAARTYGKLVGHPADLNMGDCFAYACAKVYGARLLYKGRDFSETDLA